MTSSKTQMAMRRSSGDRSGASMGATNSLEEGFEGREDRRVERFEEGSDALGELVEHLVLGGLFLLECLVFLGVEIFVRGARLLRSARRARDCLRVFWNSAIMAAMCSEMTRPRRPRSRRGTRASPPESQPRVPC